MKTIEKIIQSSTTPLRQDVVWIDTSDPSNPVVKIYVNGKWEISQPGGSGEGHVTVKSLSKEEYDALEEKDKDTLYIVKNDPTNGHEWVDIGMVDDEGYHIVWATKNIGAENPWDAGKYFAWGDTVGYYANEEHDFSQENAPYWDNDNEVYTKYNDEDGLTELQPEDDAAHVQWNGNWKIPTDREQYSAFKYLNEFNRIIQHNIYCLEYKGLIIPIVGLFENNSLEYENEYGQYWSAVPISNREIYDYCFDYEEPESTAGESYERKIGMSIRPIIKVKDLSELDPTYDIYLGESKIVDNSTKDSNMTNILYEDLVALRNSSKLVPGRYYRIIDFQTTIALTGTRSAGHQFDVIVLATDINKLSEDAKAIMHDNTYDVTFADGITKKCYLYHAEGTYYNFVDCYTLLGTDYVDSSEFEINENQKTIFTTLYRSDILITPDLQYNYFKDCNLEAWKLKYSMEEPPTRLYSSSWDSWLMYSGEYTIEGVTYHGFGTVDENSIIMLLSSYEAPESGYPVWVTEDGEEWHDGENYGESADIVEAVPLNYKGKISRMIDEFNNDCPYDFKNIQFARYKIITCAKVPSLEGTYGIRGADEYTIDESNVVYAYTFSSAVNDSVVTDYSLYGDVNSVYGNVIKEHNILNNIVFFGYTCYSNIFLYGCYSNTFWNNCYNNTFGNNCCSNTFTSCNFNIFGNNCYDNTFGSDCSGNTFGSDCYNNTFGNECIGNTFGNVCQNIIFGDQSNVKSYYRNIIVENGNKYIYLNCTTGTSAINYYQNVTISQGVNYSSNMKTINDSNVGQTYQTIYKPTGSTEIEV